MATRITYVGTHRKVWIQADTVCVTRGESVDVPDDLAAELLARTEKGVPQWTSGADDLGDLSKPDLVDRAAALDIDGRSSMTKSQLIDAIRSTTTTESHEEN